MATSKPYGPRRVVVMAFLAEIILGLAMVSTRPRSRPRTVTLTRRGGGQDSEGGRARRLSELPGGDEEKYQSAGKLPSGLGPARPVPRGSAQGGNGLIHHHVTFSLATPKLLIGDA